MQEVEIGSDSSKLDQEVVNINNLILEYKRFKPAQCKKTSLILNLAKIIMFTISDRYEVDRSVFKKDYNYFTPKSLGKADVPSTQLLIDTPREGSVISLKDSYLDLLLKVPHYNAPHAHYEGADPIG